MRLTKEAREEGKEIGDGEDEERSDSGSPLKMGLDRFSSMESSPSFRRSSLPDATTATFRRSSQLHQDAWVDAALRGADRVEEPLAAELLQRGRLALQPRQLVLLGGARAARGGGGEAEPASASARPRPCARLGANGMFVTSSLPGKK